MREIRIGEAEAGQRMDKFLFRCLPGAGKSFLYKMMRKKNIVLNGKKATGSELLKAGDALKIFFSEETLEKIKEQGSLPVWILVLPALLAVAVAGGCIWFFWLRKK